MVIVRFYLYESAIDTVLTNHKKFVNTENKFSRNRYLKVSLLHTLHLQ